MAYFVDPAGNYYEGDKAHANDSAVAQRPGPEYTFNIEFATWEVSSEKQGELEQAAKQQQEFIAVNMDPTVQALQTISDDDIDAYIKKNAGDIPGIQATLVLLARVVRLVALKQLGTP